MKKMILIYILENKEVLIQSPKVEAPNKLKRQVESAKAEVVNDAHDDGSKSPEMDGGKTLGEGDMQIQVLGKIDLDKINSKTRPDKKKKEDYKKNVKKHQNNYRLNLFKLKQLFQKNLKKKVEEPQVEAPKEIETIRVERKVLSGPTVLGTN
jgi:translation initiation factor IF-2